MSVRSTNVYEERALGVYEAADPELTTDDEPAYKGARHEVFREVRYSFMCVSAYRPASISCGTSGANSPLTSGP